MATLENRSAEKHFNSKHLHQTGKQTEKVKWEYGVKFQNQEITSNKE